MVTLTAQLAVKALDETGSVPANIASKFDRMAARVRRSAGVVGGGLRNIGAVAERTDRMVGRLQGAIGTLSPIAGAMAAYETYRGVSGLIRETVQATAARAHEEARMDVSGMSEAEIADAERVSQQLSERYRALSTTTIMHPLRNMRAIVGTYEEAGKILDPMLKLRVAAMGAHPERAGELAEEFDKLTKAFEIKGVTLDPTKFRSYMEGMAKAINVFGDTLHPVEYYQMFKYGSVAAQALSEKFMLQTAPTFAQEMGGSRTGNALAMFYAKTAGDSMTLVAANELKKFGLINMSQVQSKAGRITKIHPGAVAGWQLAASDPYEWVNKVFLPALASRGITDKARILAEIATIFGSGRQSSGTLVSILATQQARIQKDWKLIEHAKGLSAADEYMSKDPYIAAQGVREQFQNLLADVGAPLASPAATGLNALSGGMVRLERLFGALDKSTQAEVSSAATAAAAIGGLGLAVKVLTLGLSGTAAAIGRLIPLASMAAAVFEAAHLAIDIGKLAQDKFGNQQTISTVPGIGYVPGADTGTAGFPHYTVSDIAKSLGMPAVSGSADLNVQVQVEPSDSFISRIVSALHNDISLGDHGTAGSTGIGMPEAVPNP